MPKRLLTPVLYFQLTILVSHMSTHLSLHVTLLENYFFQQCSICGTVLHRLWMLFIYWIYWSKILFGSKSLSFWNWNPEVFFGEDVHYYNNMKCLIYYNNNRTIEPFVKMGFYKTACQSSPRNMRQWVWKCENVGFIQLFILIYTVRSSTCVFVYFLILWWKINWDGELFQSGYHWGVKITSRKPPNQNARHTVPCMAVQETSREMWPHCYEKTEKKTNKQKTL